MTNETLNFVHDREIWQGYLGAINGPVNPANGNAEPMFAEMHVECPGWDNDYMVAVLDEQEPGERAITINGMDDDGDVIEYRRQFDETLDWDRILTFVGQIPARVSHDELLVVYGFERTI